MVKFSFSVPQPNTQYVHIEASIPVSGTQTIVQLPAWRPGRYELGNFAKNVRNFKVTTTEKHALEFHKVTKDSWQVNSENVDAIVVSYNYYAAELNAGSTFANDEQLYVNPVNCCVFTKETYNNPVEISLEISKDWEVATSLESKEGKWYAENTEELLDSPFIASGMLQRQSYESHGVTFHVWFNGIIKPDWDRLIKDFQAFTDTQIAKFTEFPVKEYHYLNQILPYKAYHGVEHTKSTVISLGPSYEVFASLYKELLGVSSHELYHTWNVKTIRPIEMQPYDFTKENYSPLGYLCEGVTTYMGDLHLHKSGVFNLDQYLDEMNTQLQRHFDNHGRFNYSVAESSFDTWLDGYQLGAPGRKVSIYTEGCLLAFITDVKLLEATSNKYGLDEVMKRLFFQFGIEGKGVSEEDYKNTIETVGKFSFDTIFDEYIHGTKPFESLLTQCFDYLGLELQHQPDESYAGGRLGFKFLNSNRGGAVVKVMYPGGPAELGGLMLEDEIVAINGVEINNNVNEWFQYFDDEQKTITVFRLGELKTFVLPEVNRFFYNKYQVRPVENPNGPQKQGMKAWAN
ncbi:MAG: PDZ domain-containing protein [Crocinitomicaceae bacterium]